jgi:DNA-3-methyladenine glycosylase II
MTAPRQAELAQACETLAARDGALARAFADVGLPVWRKTTASYDSLARIVVYQLISTKAADAIWGRVAETLGKITAQSVLEHDPDRLLACGLSRPKLQHLQAIAAAVQTGQIDFAALQALPIAAAREQLLAVRGIGPWTADTFLMNGLGLLDAFPHGDVGLLEAYRLLTGAEARQTGKAFSKTAERWRPYRGVAAHLLYSWLHLHRAQRPKM